MQAQSQAEPPSSSVGNHEPLPPTHDLRPDGLPKTHQCYGQKLWLPSRIEAISGNYNSKLLTHTFSVSVLNSDRFLRNLHTPILRPSSRPLYSNNFPRLHPQNRIPNPVDLPDILLQSRRINRQQNYPKRPPLRSHRKPILPARSQNRIEFHIPALTHHRRRTLTIQSHPRSR